MRRPMLVTAIGAAVLLWAVVSAQQEVLPKPGPGSGIVRVTGSVDVSNAPEVQATQRGPWQVAINNVPSVKVAEMPGPSFLKRGLRYEVTWLDGQVEAVVVASARDGWIEVESPRRWINVSAVRTIQEAR